MCCQWKIWCILLLNVFFFHNPATWSPVNRKFPLLARKFCSPKIVNYFWLPIGDFFSSNFPKDPRNIFPLERDQMQHVLIIQGRRNFWIFPTPFSYSYHATLVFHSETPYHIKIKKENSGNFQHDHSTASTIEFFFYFYFSYSGKVVLK